MKSTYKIAVLISVLLLDLGMAGCKKLVEVSAPPTSLSNGNVYQNDKTAISVLTGIYTNISGASFTSPGISSISLYAGLSADELTLFSGAADITQKAFFTNALTSSNVSGSGPDFWTVYYQTIFYANSAIEGLNNSTSLTPAVKQQLLGEAEFIRAFCYFYLVNLYGDVPLVLTTDYKANSSIARSPKSQVYEQIIRDLKDAESKLSSTYLDATLLNSSAERVRPSRWAATAMLAKVYLYYGNLTGDAANYTNAESESSLLIGNASLFGLTTLDNTFLNASLGNNEAIWQIQPVAFGQDTPDAAVFVLPPSGPSQATYTVFLSPQLLNAFENGDQRKSKWISSVTDTVAGTPTTYFFAYKYKVNDPNAPVTEYETMLRLGEQYLIRAEVRAQLGEPTAVDDLNAIRQRAGLAAYSGQVDKASLLNAILHERQVELFTEMGNRWLDLKRTATVDPVMTVVTPMKGGAWNPIQQLYPIPISDMKANPKLVQNPGY
ncbi:MAG TPA: RagB/SusD family nutrient uptake outer membrane protein [Mucilaginibacter sp.]